MNGKLKKTLALTAAGVMAAVQCSTAGLFTSIAAGETAATSFPYVIEGEKMRALTCGQVSIRQRYPVIQAMDFSI